MNNRRAWFSLPCAIVACVATPAAPALCTELPLMGMTLQESMRVHPASRLIVRTFSVTHGARAGLTYVHIEPNCATCGPRVHVVGKFGNSYDIYQGATPTGAAVAINGSFFGYDQSGQQMPLGLVVADGVRRNRRIAWEQGGFLVRDSNGSTRIVPASRYRQADRDSNVIQSKPLLVEHGANGIRKHDGERFNRTAVALSTSGKLVIAGAFESFGRSTSLYEFARFLLSVKCSDGTSIEWALAMDGGPGAQIYIPALKLHFGDPGQNYVPNLVYVK